MQVSHSFWDVVQQYFAECALLPVFVLALIWIVKKWKPEYKKFIIAIAGGSVLVFNELAYRVFVAVGEGSTYYRLFWIVPIIFVIAVFAVENVTSLEKWKQAAVICASLLAVFMYCGQTGEEWFSLPENIYQVEEDVIQVADTLMELTDGEATYLIDNNDLSDTIRLYDARVMYTDLEDVLYDIFDGHSTRILGRDLIDAIWNNRSRYFALEKADPFTYKLMETSGMTLSAETDHYRIYSVDYECLYKDWIQCRRLTEGLINWATIEYIPVTGVQEQYGYVYISNFGSVENEDVYQEMFAKIEAQQPLGIIINDSLSENTAWYLQYEEKLAALEIPYYCNNQEFQVIEHDEFRICMMDNTEKISDAGRKRLQTLLDEEKPVIMVLGSRLDISDDLYSLIIEKESVVQILSAQKGEYTKELLEENVLQYVVPVDDKQIFSMLYVKGLEAEDE